MMGGPKPVYIDIDIDVEAYERDAAPVPPGMMGGPKPVDIDIDIDIEPYERDAAPVPSGMMSPPCVRTAVCIRMCAYIAYMYTCRSVLSAVRRGLSCATAASVILYL